MRALAIVVALCSIAHAQAPAQIDSFEARAQSAQRVPRIEDLVWTLVATCDTGDDARQRQCRHTRDARQAELAGQTLLVDADPEAFDVGAWNAAQKTIPFTVTACIRCLGVELDGATWYVVGSGVHAQARGDVVVAGSLHDDARAFRDASTAGAWARAVGNAHVEVVVKVPAHPRWSDGGLNGLALEVVAWRVYSPCDGAIVAASPPSGPVAPDKSQCILPARSDVDDTIVELSTRMVLDAMKPVQDAAAVCFGRLAVTGTAKLHIHVLPDGTIGRYEQQGDFVNTPMGACIDKAVAKVVFPASKDGMTILYPIKVAP
jgi:hypothetical protein